MIRPYESRDYADVAWLNETSYSSPCTESELREKLAIGQCWVYEDSPVVVGALIVCPDDCPNELDNGRALVWSVTVARNWQRRGIATQLIREASKHFLALYLYVETESPAKHLYTKEGFKAEKFLWEYYGPRQSAYLMRKGCLIQNVAV